MRPELAGLVRQLLVGSGPPESAAVAVGAARACQMLAQHVSRLVGELGVRTLFDRSIHLASTSFVCLATAGNAADGFEVVRVCLEQEDPTTAVEAATHVLVTFVGLLERFIGPTLVANLMHEVWPAIFPSAVVKETK